jgi:hypothetical protein|tara:strand:- start:689 stop:982 length:294 start_codon:yes stop_codon:yes gene_type:complete
MGGTFKKIFTKAVSETLKAANVIPSKKEQEAMMRGQQPVNEPVSAAEPDNPDEVIYAGDQGEGAPKKKKKKKSGTIMTSTTGVMGDAPTQQKTLLGG